jgi:outer membrane protein TolC
MNAFSPLVLLALAGLAAAEPVGPLTLDEAARAALDHFPTVRGARAEAQGAEAAVGEQKAARYPSLKLTGSATRYEEPSIVYPIHAFGFDSFPPLSRTVYQSGLAATYTLFDGGGRGARVREAEGQNSAAEASLAGSEQELLAQVAAKYAEILARREVLRAHERRLEALRSERARVVKFLEAGKAAKVDSLRVEAALSAADAERLRFEADLALSERDLTGLTGIARERTRAGNLVAIAIADTALTPADASIAQALEENADVREARARAAAADAGARAARGAYWPQLSVVGNYQVWSDPDGNSTGEWNAGLQLTQNLFTGGAVSSRSAQRAAANRRAEESVRLARIQTGRGVQAAHDRVRETAASARSLRAAAASYEEVARIEALTLQAGSGTQNDFLAAEADLMNARAKLAEAERAEIAARLELARLTGELSTEWLARHLEARP